MASTGTMNRAKSCVLTNAISRAETNLRSYAVSLLYDGRLQAIHFSTIAYGISINFAPIL